MNQKISDIVRNAVPAVVDMVASGKARSARVRFTGDKGFNSFVWIMVDVMQDGKLWAHTNDADFMVGYPPSLTVSRPASEKQDLINDIVAFLGNEMRNFGDKVDILLQADAADGQPSVPNFVGDSDAGWDQIHEQQGQDVP